jgi:hypothetical protein
MASPLVAGALAILLQRDPTLDQDAARALLMAGSRALPEAPEVEQQGGVGAVDLQGALRVQDWAAADVGPRGRISAERSRWLLSKSFVWPEPAFILEGYLLLRDADGEPSVVDPGALSFEADPASEVSWQRVAPSLWRVRVRPERDTGGETLRLRALLEGRLLLTRQVPVAVDASVARGGFSAQGGCSVAGASSAAMGWLALGWLALGWLGCGGRRMRRYRRAR